jgi:hypothetical protein
MAFALPLRERKLATIVAMRRSSKGNRPAFLRRGSCERGEEDFAAFNDQSVGTPHNVIAIPRRYVFSAPRHFLTF